MGLRYTGYIFAEQDLQHFYNNFWKFWDYLDIETYNFSFNADISRSFTNPHNDSNWHYQISLAQGPTRYETNWYSYGLITYLAEFGGISIFIFALVSLLIAGYQRFIKDTAMLGSLYSEEYEFSNSEDENQNGAYVSDL